MKDQVMKLLTAKKIVVSGEIIKVAINSNLSLDEFLVLIYFDNSFNNNFDIELVSKVLGLDVNKAMEAFNSLMVKGLVSLESVKDIENRLNEVVKLDGTYRLIMDSSIEESKSIVKEDIFRTFEKELGRTMSPMELELINGWLISGTSEELILGALREAVYNGVSNFRYIDKIIYEWEKKGFKTMDEVNSYIKNRYNEKSKDKVVSKKEQEISDYDWLDG